MGRPTSTVCSSTSGAHEAAPEFRTSCWEVCEPRAHPPTSQSDTTVHTSGPNPTARATAHMHTHTSLTLNRAPPRSVPSLSLPLLGGMPLPVPCAALLLPRSESSLSDEESMLTKCTLSDGVEGPGPHPARTDATVSAASCRPRFVCTPQRSRLHPFPARWTTQVPQLWCAYPREKRQVLPRFFQ